MVGFVRGRCSGCETRRSIGSRVDPTIELGRGNQASQVGWTGGKVRELRIQWRSTGRSVNLQLRALIIIITSRIIIDAALEARDERLSTRNFRRRATAHHPPP